MEKSTRFPSRRPAGDRHGDKLHPERVHERRVLGRGGRIPRRRCARPSRRVEVEEFEGLCEHVVDSRRYQCRKLLAKVVVGHRTEDFAVQVGRERRADDPQFEFVLFSGPQGLRARERSEGSQFASFDVRRRFVRRSHKACISFPSRCREVPRDDAGPKCAATFWIFQLRESIVPAQIDPLRRSALLPGHTPVPDGSSAGIAQHVLPRARLGGGGVLAPPGASRSRTSRDLTSVGLPGRPIAMPHSPSCRVASVTVPRRRPLNLALSVSPTTRSSSSYSCPG